MHRVDKSFFNQIRRTLQDWQATLKETGPAARAPPPVSTPQGPRTEEGARVEAVGRSLRFPQLQIRKMNFLLTTTNV